MDLNVSNIRHFSTVDGPGIRTTVFLKGCNLKCPWCHNPENLSAHPTVLRYPHLNQTIVYGEWMSIDAVFQELIQDKDYYEESHGGVTFSGGEAMLQAEAIAGLAARLQEHGISVLIDTAGNVPYESFEQLNPYVEGYLYDFKIGDADQYRKLIGGDLQLVRENLCRLLQIGKDVCVRSPLMPGVNADWGNLETMRNELHHMGVKRVDLLPFHRMGSGKYKAMGIPYDYEKTELLTQTQLQEIKTYFKEFFITKLL